MEKFRHEWKYLISIPEYESLRRRMQGFFHLDENAIDGGYQIRSLYFDDWKNSAYEEKEMGIFFRKKYRIRIYNFSENQIKLERKIKEGAYIYKESAPISKEEFYQILEGDYQFLLKSPHNLCREFYIECISNFMRPRVIVDYDREPYIFDVGTVRITFDRNIRAALGFDIFDRDLPTLSAMPSEKMIMEVKYTQMLPRIVKAMLPPASSEFSAASKYVLCCDQTKYLHGYDYYMDERNAL